MSDGDGLHVKPFTTNSAVGNFFVDGTVHNMLVKFGVPKT